MQQAEQPILIVGGGIAGLALARALLQRGLRAEVVERAAAWDTAGTGLFILANGFRSLETLGLAQKARRHATVITHQRLLDHRGRLLLEIDIEEIWGATGVCLGLPRRKLHEVLLQGAGSTPLRLGTTVESMTEHPECMHVRYSDGSTQQYALVVGADGIRSSVRRLLSGAVPRPVGQLSWRFILEGGPKISCWTAMVGRGRAFLMLPIGDGKLYCYADISSHDRVDPTRGAFDRFVELFADFAEPVPEILHMLQPADERHFGVIEELIQESWVHGRTVLIGDAAHASSPNMAQGASMALEDACVLSETLATRQPLTECLPRFQARRMARVRWVQEQTHRRDRTRNLPGPIRALVMRLAGRSIFKSNYAPLLAAP